MELELGKQEWTDVKRVTDGGSKLPSWLIALVRLKNGYEGKWWAPVSPEVSHLTRAE